MPLSSSLSVASRAVRPKSATCAAVMSPEKKSLLAPPIRPEKEKLPMSLPLKEISLMTRFSFGSSQVSSTLEENTSLSKPSLRRAATILPVTRVPMG
ncbi:hypothetical protein D3C72_2145940 [compost metagenome]